MRTSVSIFQWPLFLSLLTASALAQSSTFDAGNDGWTVSGNGDSPLQWFATGGNPGGYVLVEDSSEQSAWFEAPAKFLGNQSAAYGLYLRFDIRTAWPNPIPAGQVVELVGGTQPLYLRYAMPELAGQAWTSVTISLRAAAGWTIAEAGGRPTEQQLQDVLANLQHLRIDADLVNGTYLDISSVDNVTITPCAPPAMNIRISHYEICWNSCNNLSYNVQYSTPLTPNTWINLFTSIPGNGSTNCVLDSIPAGAPRRFYRVQVVE